MKMISFATILMTGAALIGCGDADPKAEKAQANKVEVLPAADSEAPQSDAVSPLYKDGINDANRGDKTGMVRVHGTINQPAGGEVTLYETEGRNTIEIAKTRLSNRAFDFGEIEVSRGFYKISLNGETNATDIILNPDEPDVELTFNSSRLSANKSAATQLKMPDGSRTSRWRTPTTVRCVNSAAASKTPVPSAPESKSKSSRSRPSWSISNTH